MVTAADNRMLSRPDHVMWVVIQQVAVRGLIAFKFLLAARLLGPELIGLVGIATLSLAIVESLSDTGLSQAVVQRHTKINPQEAGAVWTLQMSRGLVLAIALLLLAVPIAALFKVSESAGLVALAAVIPLLRNAFNPGVFLVQRDRNFRQLSLYEASAALLDFATTLLLIQLGFGAASILLGNIASDCVKLVLSWTWLRIALQPTFQWRHIRELTSFGKWIWGTSVVTLVLNQLDKVLVARFLGTTEFGLYQVASRIAQLVVVDGAVALGQYLFPTFAKLHRSSPDAARNYLSWIMWRLVPGAATVALLLIVTAGALVNLVLSSEWSAAALLLRFLAVPMCLGAIIAVLVAYLRGTGKPKTVTQATLIQLVLLVLAAPPLLYYFAAIGMASSLAIAGTAAVAYMFSKIYSHQ
jgi:O-antigen/teichoic acid export membrane protein